MSKRMYDMDVKELREFIKQQEHKVAKLNHERRGSPEADFESGILKDAKELLAERQHKQSSGE
jgi:hypothetical protein